MDEKTQELIAQLKEAIIHASDGPVGEIIRAAKEEALIEARSMLKELMVQAILERALKEIDTHVLPSAGAPVQPAPDVSESAAQIQAEIAAIKQKMAENEQSLRKGRPTTTEISQEPELKSIDRARQAPDGAAEETGEGIYVYCIVTGDSSHPSDFLSVAGLPGIDPVYPVYALPYREIQAVVSRVSLQEFGQSALEKNLNDLPWLEAKARAHQGIQENLLAQWTLVPMRFCVIYRSEDGVREMVAQYYDHLVEHLACLEGKQEWGIKVYSDCETLTKQVKRVSAQVRELEGEISRKPEGAAFFMRKKIQVLSAAEAERISDEYAQRVHNHLSGLAHEAAICSLPTAETVEQVGTMVLNGAYLVAAERLPDFQTALESLLNEGQELGFSYKMTGPWPPYHFVSIGLEENFAHEPVSG